MYHPVIFHLDLCILAYHSYHQTLAWPMDPYYEQMACGFPDKRRVGFMNRTINTLSKLDATQKKKFRGPGLTQGWESSIQLDPITTQYDRLNPWLPSILKATTTWDVIDLKTITDPIRFVKMVQYGSKDSNTGKDPNSDRSVINVTDIVDRKEHPSRPDLMYCFEGGTGIIGESTALKPANWSMMGFVLVHQLTTTGDYSVHIVFRGSRSGSAIRSPWQGLTIGESGRGNPDWVSNMYSGREKDPALSNYGECDIGFKRCIHTMIPTIVKCLTEIQLIKGNNRPQAIYVSGHSLGGGFAGLLTSAFINGTSYGPFGQGSKMPEALKNWPWKSLQLISFSAPVIGNSALNIHFNRNIASRNIWGHGDLVTANTHLDEYIKQESVRVGIRIRVPSYVDLEGKILAYSVIYHNPHLLRRGLIKWMRKQKDDWATTTAGNFDEHTLNNVPANTGEDEKDEPWRVCPTFNDVLIQLKSTNQLDSIAACFPNFGENLKIYFDTLKGAVSPEAMPKMQALQDKLQLIQASTATGEQRIQPIETAWIESDGLFDVKELRNGVEQVRKDTKVHNLIGLSLFLTGLAKEAALAKTDSATALKYEKIYTLLKNI